MTMTPLNCLGVTELQRCSQRIAYQHLCDTFGHMTTDGKPDEETDMPLYGGSDLHAHDRVVVLLNDQDQVVYQKRLPNHLPTILDLLAPYHVEIMGFVVESTSNWYWLVDGFMEVGYRVHVANPAAMQHYSGLKSTDDHSEARWLAHLLRLGV